MKSLLAALSLLIAWTSAASTVDVFYVFTDFNVNTQQVRRVVQTPLQPLADYNGAILVPTPVVHTTDTNGYAAFSNTVAGYAYRIAIDTPFGTTTRTSGFPAGLTGYVNGQGYLGDIHNQFFYYLYPAISNYTIGGGNATNVILRAGANVTVTTNSSSDWTVASTGGSSATFNTNQFGPGSAGTNIISGSLQTNNTFYGTVTGQSIVATNVIASNFVNQISFTNRLISGIWVSPTNGPLTTAADLKSYSIHGSTNAWFRDATIYNSFTNLTAAGDSYLVMISDESSIGDVNPTKSIRIENCRFAGANSGLGIFSGYTVHMKDSSVYSSVVSLETRDIIGTFDNCSFVAVPWNTNNNSTEVAYAANDDCTNVFNDCDFYATGATGDNWVIIQWTRSKSTYNNCGFRLGAARSTDALVLASEPSSYGIFNHCTFDLSYTNSPAYGQLLLFQQDGLTFQFNDCFVYPVTNGVICDNTTFSSTISVNGGNLVPGNFKDPSKVQWGTATRNSMFITNGTTTASTMLSASNLFEVRGLGNTKSFEVSSNKTTYVRDNLVIGTGVNDTSGVQSFDPNGRAFVDHTGLHGSVNYDTRELLNSVDSTTLNWDNATISGHWANDNWLSAVTMSTSGFTNTSNSKFTGASNYFSGIINGANITAGTLTNQASVGGAVQSTDANGKIIDVTKTGMSSSTFLRGDLTWTTPAGSGDVVAAGQNNFSGSNYFGSNTVFGFGLTIPSNSWTKTYTLNKGDNRLVSSNGVFYVIESAPDGTLSTNALGGAAAGAWNTAGNSGLASDGTAFLGTTDTKPLFLAVDGATVGWFSYSGSLTLRGPDIVFGGTTGASTNTITSGSSGNGNFIAGGKGNIIQGANDSGIFAGLQNTIQTNGTRAVIIGSSSSFVKSNTSEGVILGGSQNVIGLNGGVNTLQPVVIGGLTQTNEGNYSTVLGGDRNYISSGSQLSMAGGRRSKVTHAGVFSWSDSTDADTTDVGQDTFNIRAKSHFFTNSAASGSWMSFSNGILTAPTMIANSGSGSNYFGANVNVNGTINNTGETNSSLNASQFMATDANKAYISTLNAASLTNYNSTNVIVNLNADLAPTSNQTNYTIDLLPGPSGNPITIWAKNTNIFFLTITGTNNAGWQRTIILRGDTNTVVSKIGFGPGFAVWTNSNLNPFLTNGWQKALNLYNPDTKGTNVLVSDAGQYHF